MTDPRFFEWLWAMEDEIRPLMPMVYYHVWDNYPYPKYNDVFYNSTDEIVAISKVTEDIVKNVSPEVGREYLPHAVDPNIFKPFSEDEVLKLRKNNFPQWDDEDKFLIFWNNRNARRKQSGTLVWWFKEFLDIVGHDKACLLMHTDPRDINGPNLQAIIEELGLTNGEVLFSKDKILPEGLAQMYNAADCVVNLSDAEGFGLSTLESLNCGVPIVVCMTGGLQEQVTDGKNWFGVGIEPASKALVGSQQVPFIFEDRLNKQDFIDAILKMYNMTRKERRELGQAGHGHVHKNYNFENFKKRWVEIMLRVYEKHGSWNDRKNHKAWEFKEVA
jgi:glycosyltransferase involved in cell wall biosynthesis